MDSARRLAYHLQQSLHPPRALPYLLRIAREAERLYRFAEQHATLLNALEIHSDLDLELACHRAEKALDLFREADARLARLMQRWPQYAGLLTGSLARSKMEAGHFLDAVGLFEKSFREIPAPQRLKQYLSFLKNLLRAGPKRHFSPTEARLCVETLESLIQTAHHTPLRPKPGSSLYLLIGALHGPSRPDFRPSFAILAAIVYHLGPLSLAHWLAALVRRTLKQGGPATVVANIEGPLNIVHLGSPSSPGPLSKSEEVCTQLLLGGNNWDILMAFLFKTYIDSWRVTSRRLPRTRKSGWMPLMYARTRWPVSSFCTTT